MLAAKGVVLCLLLLQPDVGQTIFEPIKIRNVKRLIAPSGEEAEKETAEGQRDEQDLAPNYGENSQWFIHLATEFVKFGRKLIVFNDLLPMKTSYFRLSSNQILPICSLKYMKIYFKLKLLFLCELQTIKYAVAKSKWSGNSINNVKADSCRCVHQVVTLVYRHQSNHC